MADSLGQRGALPSIAALDLEKIKRDSMASYGPPPSNNISMPAPPLASPSTLYSGPPPPYSYPSSAASSVTGANGSTNNGPNSGHHPASHHQPAQDDKENNLAASRQSLPSITEALSIQSILTTTAPPRPSLLARSPTSPARPQTDLPPRPPEHTRPLQSPRDTHIHDSVNGSSHSYQPPSQSQYDMYPPSTPGHVSSGHASQQTPPAVRRSSPPYSYTNGSAPDRYATTPSSAHYQTSSIQPPPQSQQSDHRMNPPPVQEQYRPAFSYPSSTPSAPAYQTPFSDRPQWQPVNGNDDQRSNKDSPTSRPAYGESVKRHLDIFDLETSLNEIAEGSGRALEFSRHYGIHAHQTQRSGPLPGSLPSIKECEDMIQQQARVLDSMTRIRDVIVKQQQALVEQRKYDQRNPKSEEDDSQAQSDKLDGVGGFAGPDPKKRRGRAAPPGRCHSCNRAETPEWRRGPDGARTLCNACGLHYAKFTRKMGNKAVSNPSNLQPKSSASTP